MSDSWVRNIESAFSSDVRAMVFEAITKAYATASEHFDASRGSNELTFGVDVYTFVIHELRLICRQDNAPIRLESSTPPVVFKIGAVEFICSRVGDDLGDNIWASFPNNANGSLKVLRGVQLKLPGFAELAAQETHGLVLCHLGNPDDGLCAIYLCRPKRIEAGKVLEWDQVYELYVAGRDATIGEHVHPARAEEEQIDAPVVRRKLRVIKASE